jgi:ABC-2 type transport system ATP-binding protein
MIEAKGLARTFRTRQGPVEAVRGVDFRVDAGEIVGFLGPNGAGKTTTLRMLTTLLNPTAGTATVAGYDLRADPAGVRRRIGYVAQGGGTDPRCPLGEELILQAELYRITAAEAKKRARELCEQLDLTGLEDRLIRTLSGGQRRRLDIAMGLVHHPPLVFLDEPSTGLDPHSRSNLWDHIRRLRSDHDTTVFLTTHYLDEADALCDRILIIDHGRIVAEGTPDDLKRRIAGDVVTAEVASDAEKAKAALAGQPGVREIAVADHTLRLTVDRGDQVLLSLMRALDAANIGLASIQIARPTLDDVFLTLTGRSLRESDPEPSASA